eukprot:Plantae.Rhodophyta-Purpureofilum_apyrenoidigerum.ctg18065.p1 GENE.Plantae.Rhodophyta-Purpureofilum_apyrenoidigerum.ctg18065~~Plantae.Rhodophyta-Purpureofilum_apyrenoidigerum.ctg18065.p1  ORF type:complete len:285 (+),score=26.61 Plantae.Rhodophyta-Purpureofilum_apyrenoidigerum.ctg18065:142-996(+)
MAQATGNTLSSMDALDYIGIVTILYWIAGLLLGTLSAISPKLRAALSYGKHMRGWTARSPSPIIHALLIRGTVPNKLAWTSFYATGLIINTVLLREYFSIRGLQWRNLSAAIMFEFHVTRRLLECLYVHNFASRYLPLLHYAAAISFYFFTPMTPLLDMLLHPGTPSPSRVAAAVIMFSAGSLLQCLVHIRLADTKGIAGSSKYGVPRGGLFELVAAPHYTAELCIFCAFYLASNGTGLFALLNLMCVLVSLSQVAIETNNWYKRTFPQSLLPPRRRSIFPLIL